MMGIVLIIAFTVMALRLRKQIVVAIDEGMAEIIDRIFAVDKGTSHSMLNEKPSALAKAPAALAQGAGQAIAAKKLEGGKTGSARAVNAVRGVEGGSQQRVSGTGEGTGGGGTSAAGGEDQSAASRSSTSSSPASGATVVEGGTAQTIHHGSGGGTSSVTSTSATGDVERLEAMKADGDTHIDARSREEADRVELADKSQNTQVDQSRMEVSEEVQQRVDETVNENVREDVRQDVRDETRNELKPVREVSQESTASPTGAAAVSEGSVAPMGVREGKQTAVQSASKRVERGEAATKQPSRVTKQPSRIETARDGAARKSQPSTTQRPLASHKTVTPAGTAKPSEVRKAGVSSRSTQAASPRPTSRDVRKTSVPERSDRGSAPRTERMRRYQQTSDRIQTKQSGTRAHKMSSTQRERKQLTPKPIAGTIPTLDERGIKPDADKKPDKRV